MNDVTDSTSPDGQSANHPSAQNEPKGNPGRTQLLLMLGIMAFTLFGSYGLFKLAQGNGPWATVNKGEFVEDGVSVAGFDWRTVELAPFARDFPEAFAPLRASEDTQRPLEGRQSLKRTWWLLAVANEGCLEECAQALTQLRSLQVLLTKDATRVRRAVVLPELQSEVATALASQFPRMIQLSPGENTPTGADAPATGLYIVDPTGVMVLRYPFSGSAPDMQKDLKRLLKYSQLG